MDAPLYPPEAYCKVCGTLCFVYPSDGTQGVCPEHCPDHEYEYERGERRHMCKTCGAEPPMDWFDVD
jgi:hypothetical protein